MMAQIAKHSEYQVHIYTVASRKLHDYYRNFMNL